MSPVRLVINMTLKLAKRSDAQRSRISHNERSAAADAASTAIAATVFSNGMEFVLGGVRCARLKMAAIRRSDAPRARASCRRCGCVRAGVPTPSLAAAVPPRACPRAPRMHVPQHVRRLCPARPPLAVEPSVRQQTVNRSHSRVGPPAPRPADNASYLTTR